MLRKCLKYSFKRQLKIDYKDYYYNDDYNYLF